MHTRGACTEETGLHKKSSERDQAYESDALEPDLLEAPDQVDGWDPWPEAPLFPKPWRAAQRDGLSSHTT
jgi:hypothetical protein